MSNNGQRPQDTKGEQGWKEGSEGLHLQQSPSATDGGSCGEKGWKLIHLENVSQRRTLHLQADTPAEVIACIFCEIPSLLTPKLTFGFFTKPLGEPERVPLQSLSQHSEIWVTV